MSDYDSINDILKRRKLINVKELRDLRQSCRENVAEAKPTVEDIIKRAVNKYKLTYAVPLDMQSLVLRPEVRAMCTPEKCGRCGKTWTCPPACGSLPEIAEKLKRFKSGLLLATVADLRDQFDYEGMKKGGEDHKAAALKLYAELSASYQDAVILSAGSCSFCLNCSYPDRPCRFPDFAFPSMEACGLLVSEVCQKNNLPFYTGKNNLMSFVSCILFV